MKWEQAIVVFSKDLYKSLCKRIEGRWTVYSFLLNFLKNPNKESEFGKGLDTTLIKSELKALILCFAKGPDKNSISLDRVKSISDASQN